MDRRITLLRKHIADSKSAVLITSDVNRFYFTGFKSSAGAVLVTKDSVSLLVDFRYALAAKNSVSEKIDVICYTKLSDSLNDIFKKEGIESIVIEDEDVTVATLNKFKYELKVSIIDDFSLSDKILNLRMIKSESEVEKIRKAQSITEKSYLELLNFVKPGVSEKRLATELEHLMKLNGAEKIAFDIISISGKNTSLPHGVPSDKLLCSGEFITFDIGAVYDGYHSDMTRTVVLSSVSDEMAQVYDVVLNAHLKAAEKIKAGVTCADIDNIARDFISQNGYGEYFGHTTGHGVGLQIHEKPTVYLTNKMPLESGMIITVEPGIYLPDKFGVRIEDMYLVTDCGCEDLATIDKELLIL